MRLSSSTLERPLVREAQGAEEREQAYRFWYDTYVVEMRRPVHAPDHERRRLVDSLESRSTIVAAFARGEIVGTVRLSFPWLGPISYYERLYQIEGRDERSAIVTKYMVHARYRASSLPYELACEALVACAERKVCVAYMDCNEHLFGHFSALGFVEHTKAIHPEFGEVRVMKYDLSDPERMLGLLGGFVRKRLLGPRNSPFLLQTQSLMKVEAGR